MAKQMNDGLSRRDFLKGAAVVGGAAGLGAMGLPGVASAAEADADWMPKKWDYTTDVLVIGTGYAGQGAAIEAAKHGAHVLVIEKAPFRERGGNSRVCGQGLLAPSPAIHEDYITYLTHMTEGQGFPTTHGEGFTSDDTIRFYVEQSFETRTWFESLGMPLKGANNGGGPGRWMPFYPHFPGADAIGTEDQYWTHTSKVAGAEPKAGNVWANLEKWILDNTDVEFMYKTAAKKLVQNPNTREVLGLIVTQGGKEKAIKARKGVVVCAGGWEYNWDMVRDFNHMPELYSIGGPFNTGETIKMCWDAGAAPRNMGVTAAPTYRCAGVMPGYKGTIQLSNTTRQGPFIMIGRNNKRFIDEFRGSVAGLQNKAISELEGTLTVSGQELRDGAYVPQSNPEPIHMIFDEVGLKSGAMFSMFFGWAYYVEGFRGSADNSAELANGWILKGDTIEELAEKMGRDPAQVQATIDKWNEDCDAGKDTQFDHGDPTRAPYARPANRLQKFTDGPFYAIACHQCTLNTQGGMVRNLKSQVMSIEGPPIPRLYAAGENGDIFTILYQCMSNAGSGCLVHGRVAGGEAAQLESWDAPAAKKAAAAKAAPKKAKKPAAKKKATRK
ncbi:MAG: FAD-dependent oxidoreductase [Actinobacteria bacterium]|nr:FAD-dependent oxidoreductase [Actinomycetota bacterium]